ncbi:MAG: GTPase HflX [Actinobacteria bacterium]|nr:GTPase HflX [Actinomycetota bacterium]MCL6104327.1 GTPase HflX [Actinomycetota bacterium]
MALIERTFRERIVLVGVALKWQKLSFVEANLDELKDLVNTAGADVVARTLQHRDVPDPATYLGKGKVAQLYEVCESLDADTVVFDDELTPVQQRNLEKLLGRTAIDRTAVILDIFAQNARSEEGKAQVELALVRYILPRLKGKGVAFSQQAGGIGTRGPGETQLEVDRRRLERRTKQLEANLSHLSKVRKTQRRARKRSNYKTIALVGYTNTGKSTLLNRLTKADVLVEDRLFATLDPRTRKLWLEDYGTVLCSDTVGFIRKLPHQLVQAFHSTLEVVTESDLLLHVVDVSCPSPQAQIAAVREVLAEIEADQVPELIVFNKIDAFMDQESIPPTRVVNNGEGLEDIISTCDVGLGGYVCMSAIKGWGLGELRSSIKERLGSVDRVFANQNGNGLDDVYVSG